MSTIDGFHILLFPGQPLSVPEVDVWSLECVIRLSIDRNLVFALFAWLSGQTVKTVLRIVRRERAKSMSVKEAEAIS